MSFTLRTTAALALALSPLTAQAVDSFTYLGFDEASLSPEAQEGLREIYSGRTFHAAIPVSLIEALAAADSPEELGYDPSTPEGQFYSAGRIPSPPNRETAPGVSLGQSVFERNGALLANGNCFGCHAGVVNGQVVAGLGNNSVMQSVRRSDGSGPSMFEFTSALKSVEERKELAKAMGSRMAAETTLPETSSRGDNFGPFAVWALGARLASPAETGLTAGREKTELVELLESTVVPAVDPMPWWLMKYKVRDYWYADGGIFDAAHFSFNFTTAHAEANENHAAHVDSTAKALAFARETQSPVYPAALDAGLVKQGADLFHGRKEPKDTAAFKACFECHGTYTRRSEQLDFAKPGGWIVDYNSSEELKKVRTDGTYNEVLQKFRPIAEHINDLKHYFAAQGTPELAPQEHYLEGKGYVAPPLDGVWATAPYFHNGSVPTVEAVLNSELRPEIWSRDQSPYAYDLESMGLRFTPLTRAEYDASAEKALAESPRAKASVDHMFNYDTKSYGHGNMGHTFGDSLTGEERAAIMEFLKSLSGPDMAPKIEPHLRLSAATAR